MGPGDWLVLLLASAIVGGAVAAEVHDIEICQVILSRASIELAKGLRMLLLVLLWLRKWVFLQGFVASICVLVAQQADALSICLNTLALLFLTEVDNASYAVLLDDDTRTGVERKARQMPASAEIVTSTPGSWRSAIVAITILFSIERTGSANCLEFMCTIGPPFLAALGCGLSDAILWSPATTARVKIRDAFLVVACWIGGVILFAMLFSKLRDVQGQQSDSDAYGQQGN